MYLRSDCINCWVFLVFELILWQFVLWKELIYFKNSCMFIYLLFQNETFFPTANQLFKESYTHTHRCFWYKIHLTSHSSSVSFKKKKKEIYFRDLDFILLFILTWSCFFFFFFFFLCLFVCLFNLKFPSYLFLLLFDILFFFWLSAYF